MSKDKCVLGYDNHHYCPDENCSYHRMKWAIRETAALAEMDRRREEEKTEIEKLREAVNSALKTIELIQHWKSDANVCCFPTTTVEATRLFLKKTLEGN